MSLYEVREVAMLSRTVPHTVVLVCVLVYPLLQYEPSVLAVTAIVCGAKLISGSWDEELNRGLIGELQSAPRGPQLYCIVTIVTHGSQISRA